MADNAAKAGDSAEERMQIGGGSEQGNNVGEEGSSASFLSNDGDDAAGSDYGEEPDYDGGSKYVPLNEE